MGIVLSWPSSMATAFTTLAWGARLRLSHERSKKKAFVRVERGVERGLNASQIRTGKKTGKKKHIYSDPRYELVKKLKKTYI